MDIEEKYQEQLKDLCDNFRFCKKCKEHDRLCFMKKRAYQVAQILYKKRVKEGRIDGLD